MAKTQNNAIYYFVGEARRIKRCNGRVFAHQDEPDVSRLWLPNCNSPGLAMARAFGDFCLKDFGLTCVPEVTYRQISKKDEFIILATDGVMKTLVLMLIMFFPIGYLISIYGNSNMHYLIRK